MLIQKSLQYLNCHKVDLYFSSGQDVSNSAQYPEVVLEQMLSHAFLDAVISNQTVLQISDFLALSRANRNKQICWVL